MEDWTLNVALVFFSIFNKNNNFVLFHHSISNYEIKSLFCSLCFKEFKHNNFKRFQLHLCVSSTKKLSFYLGWNSFYISLESEVTMKSSSLLFSVGVKSSKFSFYWFFQRGEINDYKIILQDGLSKEMF